jgi:hypothetical protein
MKAKIKFDQNAIKSFFLDHVEKLVFSAVLLGVAAIVYGAIAGRDKFDKTPSELNEKAAAADAKIVQSSLKIAPVANIDQIAVIARQPIEEKYFEITKRLNPPPKLERPRGMPKILPVEDLRVGAGMGMFQIQMSQQADKDKKAAAASDLRGERWVVITGLVPLKKQIEAYGEAFSECKPWKNDAAPMYAGYRLERLEVTDNTDLDDPKCWEKAKKIGFKGLESVPKDWGAPAQEMVDPRYSDPSLTYPLGPWSDGTWGENVAHAPKIPVMSLTGNQVVAETVAEEEPTETEKPAGEGDVFANSTAKKGGAANATQQPQQGAANNPGMMNPYMMQGMGPRGGYPGMGMTGMTDDSVEFRLLRYFDFTVEPGKRYVYRVQLVVHNPNFGVKEAYLEKSEFGAKEYVGADWSEKSPIVSVPQNTSTLAIAVEQQKRDTIGSMLVALWQKDTGKKVYNEFGIERGQLLNYANVEVKAAVRKGGPATLDSDDKTDMLSNVLVVDLSGGKKLPTKKPVVPDKDKRTDPVGRPLPSEDRMQFSPGEILIMEPNGTLLVRKEFDDMTAVENFTTQPEMPVGGPMGPGGRTPYGPGMYGPGAYGPGMRGPGGPGMMGPGMMGPGMMGPGYGGLFPQGNPQPKK